MYSGILRRFRGYVPENCRERQLDTKYSANSRNRERQTRELRGLPVFMYVKFITFQYVVGKRTAVVAKNAVVAN